MVRLSRLTSLLDEWYDPSTAEDWDAVGLVCGDPDERGARGSLFAVDPAPAVVAGGGRVAAPTCWSPTTRCCSARCTGSPRPRRRAGSCTTWSAPAARCSPRTPTPTRPADGVSESLALRARPARRRAAGARRRPTPLDKLVVFVPARRRRRRATRARRGRRRPRSATTTGVVHRRRARAGSARSTGATPAIGAVGELEVVDEARVEVGAARATGRAVVAAMLAAHPYEEPAYDVVELADPGDEPARGQGRIGTLAAPMTLREFAEHVAAALPATAHGVRVAGDPDRPVRTVALCGGAGDFLLDHGAAHRRGRLRDLRPAPPPGSEFREHGRRPALVDVAHWAAEWTWLPGARAAGWPLGLGDTVETRVSTTAPIRGRSAWTPTLRRHPESRPVRPAQAARRPGARHPARPARPPAADDAGDRGARRLTRPARKSSTTGRGTCAIARRRPDRASSARPTPTSSR